jgi:hypothetical protein
VFPPGPGKTPAVIDVFSAEEIILEDREQQQDYYAGK